MASRKKKTSSVKVNFKGVESRRTPPEGDYALEILEANSSQSSGGNDQIEFILEISRGEYKGTKLWFYCPLMENSLWKLHAFLTALGEEVPEDEIDIDLDDLVGKEVVGVLTHETYQGRKRAKMTDFDSIDNYDSDKDDDKKSKKSKKSKDDDDEAPAKGKKSKKDEKPKREEKSSKKSKADEDDDDDEDEKPKSKKDKGKKTEKVKKYSADDIDDMDEDELEAVIKKHKLEVDLDDIKKLSKKQAAVKDALEDEDLLEDDD